MSALPTEKSLSLLKIKCGVVQRLGKEIDFYKKDLEKEKLKIQNMEDNCEDEYNIRKRNEVMEETRNMIPAIKTKFQNAYIELKSLVDSETFENEKFSEIYQMAQKILVDMKSLSTA